MRDPIRWFKCKLKPPKKPKITKRRLESTSPRKKGKKKSKSNVTFDTAGSETGSDTALEAIYHGKDVRLKTRSRSRSSSKEKGQPLQSTVAITFCEEDNEYVEMQVENEMDFLSNEDGNSSSEEEGEISFNNNASRTDRRANLQLEMMETVVPVPELDGMKRGKQKDEEEDKEARIVSKTVEKIKELMEAGGYFSKEAKTRQHNRNSEKNKATGESKDRDKHTVTQNNLAENSNGLLVENSLSESTIYKNAVLPVSNNQITVKDVELALTQLNEVEGKEEGKIGKNRESTSEEEELINTSDETTNEQINTFLLDVRNNLNPEPNFIGGRVPERNFVDQPQPSTSRQPTQAIRSAIVRPPPQQNNGSSLE